MLISTITLSKNKAGLDEIIIENGSNSERFTRDLDGDFSAQRNFALGKCRTEWVFFLDSDERIEEDFSKIPSGFDAFKFRRLDSFLGITLMHGETGNIQLVRLAKKGFGKWTGHVHETWQGDGKIGSWPVPIYHTPHKDIREFISKINYYSDIYSENKKTFSYLELLKPIGKFLVNYLFKLGFLDGFPGFVMAYMMSLNSLITRVKQYEKKSS